MKPITCAESNELRATLRPISSITNYVGGEVLNHNLPPHTATTWGRDDETEVMREVLDEDGCRHWLIEGDES